MKFGCAVGRHISVFNVWIVAGSIVPKMITPTSHDFRVLRGKERTLANS